MLPGVTLPVRYTVACIGMEWVTPVLELVQVPHGR